MDPTACMNRMFKGMEDIDWNDAVSAAKDLRAWLRKGGCVPKQCEGFGKNAFWVCYTLINAVLEAEAEPA